MRSSTRQVSVAANAVAEVRPADADFPGYWRHAMAVVLVMTGVVAVRIHEFFPGIGVIKPVVTFSIGGFAVLVARSPRLIGKAISRPLDRLVWLYLAMVTLSVPFALWRGGAAEVVELLLPAVLMYTAFAFVPPTRRVLQSMEFGFVVLVLFFAWYVQFFGGTFRGRLISLSGSFDSNDVASLLALTLPLAIGMLARVKAGKERVGAILAVLALVLGVIATGSRGGFLALLAGALVYVLGLRGTRRIAVLGAMIVGGAIFWATAPGSFRERVHSLTRLENDYNTTSEAGRKAIWRRARLYIRQYPVTGVGAGNFFVAEGGYNAEVGRTGKWSAAHNAYLQALAELGIPGGTVYFLMLLTGAAIALRLWNPKVSARSPPDALHRPEYLAGLLAFATGAIFLSHAYFTPQFALLGLIGLADRVTVRERARGGADSAPVRAVQGPVRMNGQRGGLSIVGAGSWNASGTARSIVPPIRMHSRGGA